MLHILITLKGILSANFIACGNVDTVGIVNALFSRAIHIRTWSSFYSKSVYEISQTLRVKKRAHACR